MRFYTDERSEFNELVAGPRRVWLLRHPICWWCVYPSQGVHEIGAAGIRRILLPEPCSWAAACNRCNQGILTDYSIWPVVRQMAVKLRWNSEDVNLRRYNELRGRGADALTLREVRAALRKLIALEEV
jgi:hypothetical protein